MIIEGDFTIQAPLQKVWEFLIDIERLSVCLPGVEKIEQVDEQNYKGTVTVKVGPIATSFQGTVTKTVEEPPRLLKAKLQGKDQKTASMVTGEFTSELSAVNSAADGETTMVSYKFDLLIRGRLGQFGQAVIMDTSRQLTDEFVKCVRTRIEQPESPQDNSVLQVNVAAVAIRAFFANLWDRIRRLFRQAN